MKALKYGLTLLLGLSVCSFGTRVFAQASGQTAEGQSVTEQASRGVQMPETIMKMLDNGDYAKAVMEFEKFNKVAKGTPCDLKFLPFSFYYGLLGVDTTRTAFYQEKVDYYLGQFMQACGNTVEAYVLKESMMEPKNYDSTVVWMTAAIKLDPNYAHLYLTRGVALWELGQTKEACADFEKAKELNPEFADYYQNNCEEKKEEVSEESDGEANE